MTSTTTQYDYLFKIIVIGNSGVGKSSLFNRFIDNTFSESYQATLGVDFKIKTVIFKNKLIKLTLWDTAGQERFEAMTAKYYRGANGVFLVYDVTDGDSFESVEKWDFEVEKEIGQTGQDQKIQTNQTNQRPEKIILGNKSDLLNKIAVSEQMSHNLSQKMAIPHFRVSAKNNSLVEVAFQKLIAGMVEKAETLKSISSLGRKKSLVEGVDLGRDGSDENGSSSRSCC